MFCPLCQKDSTRVIDSRVTQGGLSVRRRRECLECGHRFSTIEEMEILDLVVVKRDGRREAYQKEKLIRGLERALEKRDFNREDFHGLVQKIERDIQKRRKQSITSEEIGQIVINHLRSFDQVAYIRFASVYRSFDDVASFQKELNELYK